MLSQIKNLKKDLIEEFFAFSIFVSKESQNLQLPPTILSITKHYYLVSWQRNFLRTCLESKMVDLHFLTDISYASAFVCGKLK